MKRLILFFSAFLFVINAFAISRSELCSFRARIVESLAQSRDAGKSEAQAAAEVKKALRELVPIADTSTVPTMRAYVRMVYEQKNRNVSPYMFREITEISCLRGD